MINKGKEKIIEIEKIVFKPLKFRELLAYIWGGMLLSVNIILGYILYTNRAEYFNYAVDFSKTITAGLFIVKMLIIVAVLVFDFKILNTIKKIWDKHSGKEYIIPKIKGEEGYKRIGFIRRMWFYWETSKSRSLIDKYNMIIRKMEMRVGKIRGNETKELKRLKEELIKGILIWTEDFAITRINIDAKGRREITNIKVDWDFLESLNLDELYELYAVRCVESSNKFVNGVTPNEIMEDI